MIELVQHFPALAIGVPLAFAFLLPLLKKWRNSAVIAALAALAVTEFLALFILQDVLQNGIRIYSMGAVVPGLATPEQMAVPVRILLSIDAFSAFMGAVAATIALLAGIYSIHFIRESHSKYFSLLLLMLAGALGLVFTGDMFNMFVFFEVLSISSIGLIAFWLHRAEPVEAGFKYLAISAVASIFVLFAVGLLYGQHGVLNIAGLSRSTLLYGFAFTDIIALALLVCAFSMKAGAAPMHYWVPDAYGEAPAAVTAMLAVASLASLYALFRIAFTVFGATPLIELVAFAVIIFGVLSLFLGATMSLVQKDLKRLIAYAGISQTGFILVALGVGLAAIHNTPLQPFGAMAMEGGVFHVINHAFYEALLFLCAGAVFLRTGTKDLNELGGLARRMPFTAFFFLIGGIAIAGLPPSSAFASKILIYESVYFFNPLIAVIALVSSVLVVVPMVKAFCAIFLGPEIGKFKKVREVPGAMLFTMLVLSALVIIFGLFPGAIVETIVSPAVNALLSQSAYVGGVL